MPKTPNKSWRKNPHIYLTLKRFRHRVDYVAFDHPLLCLSIWANYYNGVCPCYGAITNWRVACRSACPLMKGTDLTPWLHFRS